MRTTTTRAIVLRRTNYGEADRVLQLLTPEGRRSVMARGVRKQKSKLAGGIELFAICDVVLGEGKGNLGVLTSSRLVHFYRHIIEDYDRLQFGYFVIQQVTKGSENVDEPEWYDLMSEVLMGLDATSIPVQLTQTWFYLRYAGLLGHQLNLEIDTEGERLDPARTYRYDVSEQGLREAPNGDITGDHIKLLRLLSTRSIKILAQIGGIGEILPACLQVSRSHAAL
jgi:DNA repair protein RecO (recombination protein O)